MLISTNWLRDFLPVDIPPADIADRLTMAGIEVEGMTSTGHQWNHIVVGEVLEISPHPNAASLSLTRINAGDRTFRIVCGAPNIKVGLKVPLALDGAHLPSGIKIKRAKIRGEPSEGMLCSETELDLGPDSSGIMILPPQSQPGTSLAECLCLSDTILDLSITPNRGDCLCVVGIARELSALFSVPLTMPPSAPLESGPPVGDMISVEIEAPDLCPRYTARVISGVTVAPSPLWIRRRLETCGIRSINNIVDTTNYILLEWGQPLHAFDLALIDGARIIVKRANRGDTFITLDECTRTLDGDTVMICDATRPVAIGGIMGGLNSGVSDQTTDVLLESAYFTPFSTARTCRALNLKTESAQRFEKGIDLHGVAAASHRAASLMAELSGGKISTGFIDVCPCPLPAPPTIMLDVAQACSIIGLSLSRSEVTSILDRVHIQNRNVGDGILETQPPSFRSDIKEPIDLVEEIARLKGYEHIPATYPQGALSPQPFNASRAFSAAVRNLLISRGFTEVINYSFCAPEIIEHLNFPDDDPRKHPVRLLNPLSSDMSVLRTTIIPSLILNLTDNLNSGCPSLKIFEISRVFYRAADDAPPVESLRVAGLIYGQRYETAWNLQQQPVDFYDMKGSVETLLERLHVHHLTARSDGSEPFLHPKHMLSLFVAGNRAGSFGELHPEVAEKFGLQDNVYLFDLDMDALAPSYTETLTFIPFSRFPAVYRDLALIVDAETTAEAVENAIRSRKNKLITDVTLFDSYRGTAIPAGKKSLAFRIKFQSSDRTLMDREVNKIHDELVARLAQEIGAVLRS